MNNDIRILVVKDGKVIRELSDVYHMEVHYSKYMNECGSEHYTETPEYRIKAYAEKMRVPEEKED